MIWLVISWNPVCCARASDKVVPVGQAQLGFVWFRLPWQLISRCSGKEPALIPRTISKYHYINPLTPGAFCKKRVFWTFWRFSGWISTKLPLIWSKKHLQRDSSPSLPQASHFNFMTFWLGHALKSKFWFLNFFFRLSFFSFSSCCSDWPPTGLAFG